MKPKRLESLSELLNMFEVRYHGAIEALADASWYLVIYEDTDFESPLYGDRVVVGVHQDTGFTGLEQALNTVLTESTGDHKYPVSRKYPTAYWENPHYE
jgi:hypothetical protein